MLVRIVNMRGQNLNLFDFDFDLTWAAFFMNDLGHIYGRYGGRDEGPADKGLSIDGLNYAMQRALDAHRQNPRAQPALPAPEVRTVEQYPAAKRMKADACIHCHQVYDFSRQAALDAGNLKKDDVWVYPPPKNVGVELDIKQGDRIAKIVAGSPAARAGLRAGDTLTTVNNLPVASYADVQYALHRAPPQGRVQVAWMRDGKSMEGTLELASGWRQTDIVWRESMWSFPPAPGVSGRNLTSEERRKNGLDEKQLAFRQMDYVGTNPGRAGFRPNDIVLGINGKRLEMTPREFQIHLRLNFNVGDRVVFNVIREGKRLEFPMILPVNPRD